MIAARFPVIAVVILICCAAPPAAVLAQGASSQERLGIIHIPLKEGAQGEEVRTLQARLKDLRFFQGPVTGFFGPLTAEAVRRFQKAHGLPAVGYVGPRTLAALSQARRAPVPDPKPAPPPAPSPEARREPAPAKPAIRRLPIPPPEDAGPAGGGRLALTFDDGPEDTVLPRILNTLRERRVQATFFLIGREVEKRPALVRRLVAEGHEVENHGYGHVDLSGRPADAGVAEVEGGARAIRTAAGVATRYFRPARGAFDAATVRAARAAGHRLMLWTNVGAPDVPFPGREALVKRLTEAAFDGAVILLHADRPETAAALPAVLDAWAAKGYRPVRLDALDGDPSQAAPPSPASGRRGP